MASKRYLYSDTIDSFLQKNTDTIVGEITLSATQDINKETSNSWQQEVEVLKNVLSPYAQKGSVYFEYNIPRMGRRADVIVLIDGIVFVLEFKTSEQKFTREALIQVWDYAIDLKNFQEGSRDRILIPIVVAPKEKNKNCHIELKPFEDDVYQPLVSNNERLSECFDKTLSNIIPKHTFTKEDDDVWAKSGYDPTPTIIEAAVALYEHHTVEEITKHDGEIEVTAKCLDKIINECQSNKRKAICFITGVPGAGKTLIGLQTAIKQFEKENKAVYLSGNYPLVEVLQEALARDYVKRSRDDYKKGKTNNKPCTKTDAKSKVKAFIQMIHHYRDLYLEGTEVKDGQISPVEGYFQSHTDKAYVPAEHIAIFDEAQRAWTKEELARFMKEKKKIENFPFSEPESTYKKCLREE